MAVLVIGSTVADISICLPNLPQSKQDLHTLSQHISIGGCGYNVARAIQAHQIRSLDFLSPIGQGIFGEYIYNQITPYFPHPLIERINEENGCTYCLIEPSGERTFISHHGAEYQFKAQWFQNLNKAYDYIYVCGLEIEEQSGDIILDYLETQPQAKIVFSPSPRIKHINHHRLNRLCKLHPMIHMNQEECREWTNDQCLEDGLKHLYETTHEILVVTLGKDGCFYFDGDSIHHVAGYSAEQINSNGAGDAHCGTMIAMRAKGMDWQYSLSAANQSAAKVVQSHESVLDNTRR